MSLYRLWLSGGSQGEFRIDTGPWPRTREWRRRFALTLADTIKQIADQI